MALIKCKSCGKEISDKSTKCVHCGCDTDYSITHFCPECGKKYDNIKCMNCGYTKSNDSKERATNQGKVIRFNFIPLLKSLGITGLFTILLSLQSGGLDIIGCFVLFISFIVGCLVFYGCGDIFDRLDDFHASTHEDPYKRALYKQIKKNNRK